MIEQYNISTITFDEYFMYLTVNEKEYKIDLQKTSKILFNASLLEKNSYRVLYGGDGITWFPVLNEDLSVKNLMRNPSE